MNTMWLWEQAEGEDRMISNRIVSLKKHIESKYTWEKGAKVTYHPYGDYLVYVHYNDREIGFLKQVQVI